jgi:NAD(P)-dependent dehydrogenase (short-subunit alcohol dehydrogenase family)
MRQLDGKVAIVTGAGSGIGRASACLFAEQGAKIVVADCNVETGKETVAAILQNGHEAIFCHVDVSRAAEVEQLIQTTIERYGRLDALFNNAAIQILGRLIDTSEESWDRVHSVNLKGVFLGCKYAIPAMILTSGGSIINMASVLGFVGDPDLAAYCAAKGGVIALTKAAALSYGPNGVRVNCICPGDVETPMVQDYFNKDSDPERARREVSARYALRRIASPREVAQMAVFLASDASSFVTAGALVVDGGLTSRCY